MKVLHVLDKLNFSGAEVMLKVAAPVFIKNGFNLHVLSTGEEIGDYADILRSSGYTLHHIPFRKSLSYFANLYHLLQKEQFDVVHIHPERAFFWHVLTARIVKRNSVTIRTAHSVFCFSGFLRLKRMLQRFVARTVFGVKFISISASVAEVEQRSFHNRTLVIPNWIDQSNFLPAQTSEERDHLRKQYGISPKDITVISVGSCTDVKNHKAIITAVAEVKKKFNHIVYLHVGEGPLVEKEKELASKCSIEDRTVFLGQMEVVRDALVAGDIFVISSQYEGFGVAGLEAMSCGLPVIAYDVYGLRDIVEDGKNGMLVEPNPRALAKAIETLVSTGELRRRMGVEAYESVSRRFNIKESLENLMRVYGCYGKG